MSNKFTIIIETPDLSISLKSWAEILTNTMFIGQNKYLERLRSLSVHLLVIAFLLLSYCPLRKAIQNLINGTHETEQLQAGHGRTLTSVICSGVVNNSSTRLSIPEPKIDISNPVFNALILLVFGVIWRFTNFERRFVPRGDDFPYCLNAVPIYLRNRTLLI